jgi:hypothetical protein
MHRVSEPLYALVTPDQPGQNVAKVRRLLEAKFGSRIKHRRKRARASGPPCQANFRFIWMTEPGARGEGLVEVRPNCFCNDVDDQEIVFEARIATDFSEVVAYAGLPLSLEEKLSLAFYSWLDTLHDWTAQLAHRPIRVAAKH